MREIIGVSATEDGKFLQRGNLWRRFYMRMQILRRLSNIRYEAVLQQAMCFESPSYLWMSGSYGDRYNKPKD